MIYTIEPALMIGASPRVRPATVWRAAVSQAAHGFAHGPIHGPREMYVGFLARGNDARGRGGDGAAAACARVGRLAGSYFAVRTAGASPADQIWLARHRLAENAGAFLELVAAL